MMYYVIECATGNVISPHRDLARAVQSRLKVDEPSHCIVTGPNASTVCPLNADDAARVVEFECGYRLAAAK